MEIPEEEPDQEEETKQNKVIQGHFSQEFYVNKKDLAEFLRNLADEVESEGEITIKSEDWELPFNPRENAELEIELDDDELEIEIEFEEAKHKDKGLTVG